MIEFSNLPLRRREGRRERMGLQIQIGAKIRTTCLLAAAIAVVSAWIAPTVVAGTQEFCVKCKDPKETYRCRVDGVSAKARDAVKLYCVFRTAKDGGHSSCAARGKKSACDGPVKAYKYDGPSLPAGLTSDKPVRKARKQPAPKDEIFTESTGSRDTTSLIELGGQAMDASRTGLRNAGAAIGLTSREDEIPGEAPLPEPEVAEADDEPGLIRGAAQTTSAAVGGFARRSYRCMTSFFSECRGE